ncbi:thermonuclease family protein [Jiella sp. MQZ9-1]|uniref:Thermonuclease family protein n=1 Tax=Jiella flava TaxID=2816857 RepID=A0A939FYE3_9HYPH|nr:thermonuclease family protein [Jiella flava]MBO0664298.1 thermonuclease family protein [Jiella flava]MCD2472779.1 thermonuclease family protein [Jiella flava]
MHLAIRLALIGCVFASSPGHAADEPFQTQIAGPVAAKVVKVRDGDTVEVEAYVWPMQSVHVAVRLRGIDAPEMHGKCPAEKAAAARATDRLKALLDTDHVYLTDISGGKYFGRVLARLGVDGNADLGRTLLKEGLVVPYQGGKRRDWCDDARLRSDAERPAKAGSVL